MRDRIGNKIEPGHLVVWLPQQMVVEVLEVDDGLREIEVPGQPPQEYGMVTFKVSMPLSRQGLRPTSEMLLPEFVRCISPKSEKVLDDLASGKIPALMRHRKPS
jgi:hypothetical protein